MKARTLANQLSLLFLLLSVALTHSETLTLRAPAPNATVLASPPLLVWSYNTTNVLENGGFESGLSGWTATTHLTIQTNAPAEGNFCLRGYGSLTKEVLLPNSPAILLSFACKISATLTFAVLSPAGQVLYQSPPRPPQRISTDWIYQFHDLGIFRGQSVQLYFQLVGTYHDSGPRSSSLDDIQLLVGPPDAYYDIYTGHPSIFVGRTNSLSWPLHTTGLKPHFWRVESSTALSTNRVPSQSFSPNLTNTAIFSLPPVSICLASPLPLVTQIVGRNWFLPGTETISLLALADNVKPPSILITEVDTGPAKAVEFANLSPARVDLSDWTFQIYPLFNSSTPLLLSRRIHAPAFLEPGQLFTFREGEPQNLWPRLQLPVANWNRASPWGAFAALVLRDRQSNIVDAVVIHDGYASNYLPPAVLPIFSPVEWRGYPVFLHPAPDQTHSRFGNRDSNQAQDWFLAPRSIGTFNSNLASSFEPGLGQVQLHPSTISSYQGRSTNLFTFQSPASNVVILALGKSGHTRPFSIVDANHCTTLTGPALIRENDRVASFQLSLGTGTQTAVPLNLHSSDPRRLPVPDTILIPAGQSEFTFEIPIPNDPFVQGNASLVLTATPEGYASATWQSAFHDDETAVITITGPALIKEGQPENYTIKIHPTPIADIPIQIDFSPDLFNDYTRNWPAGTTEQTEPIGWTDYIPRGTNNITMTASYEDWTPGSWRFNYEDTLQPTLFSYKRSDSNQITIYLYSVPGQTYQLFSKTLSPTPSEWLPGETKQATGDILAFSTEIADQSRLFQILSRIP